MLDFTQKKYTSLLEALIEKEYHIIAFEDYCSCNDYDESNGKYVILRHDVDLKAENSLEIAKIENRLKVRSVYYFRYVKQSNKPEIMKEIASLGHEIGYHYEDMAVCG